MHAISSKINLSFLYLQVKGMLTDFGDDMHCQFLEILRSLLDSFTLSGAQVSVLAIHSGYVYIVLNKS